MLPDYVDEKFKDWLVGTMSANSLQDLYELYLNDQRAAGLPITDAEINRFTAYVAEHDIRDLRNR